MSKPTPRPWKIQKFRYGSRQPIGPDDFFTCAYVSGADNGEIQANAAHIVKCVNMHQELVTAAKEIVHAANAALFQSGVFGSAEDARDSQDKFAKSLGRLEAVFAKAEADGA